MKETANAHPSHKEIGAEVLQWLGPKIRKRMEELGLSLSALAKMTEIGASTISDYLTGRYEPNLSKIVSLSSALEVDWRFFFERDFAVVEAADLRGDLVLHLDFNEGGNNIARDLSNYHNDGILHGVEWTRDGKCGGAAVFDGEGSWIEVPNSPSLNPAEEISIVLWVCATRYSGECARYVAKHWAEFKAPWFAYGIWERENFSGRAGFTLSLDDGREARCGTHITPQKPLNQWTHLAATYDGGEMRLYYDGKLVATTPASGRICKNDVPLAIGGNNVADREYHVGLIDEVAVFSKALTESEVRQAMDSIP